MESYEFDILTLFKGCNITSDRVPLHISHYATRDNGLAPFGVESGVLQSTEGHDQKQ